MRNKSFEELQSDTLHWGNDLGILKNSDAKTQFMKTVEECGELADALIKDDKIAIKDAYGDIVVTLIMGSHLSGFDLVDCLSEAYDVISKRTGTMQNGLFVKDK